MPCCDWYFPFLSLYEISHSSSDSKKRTWHRPSFPYIFAGRGVVLLISSVTKPSHSGSKGVTFTIIPQRAYVDLPTHSVNTLRGIRKYSTERPSANEFGGTMQTSPLNSTNDFESKFLGSTIVEFTLVKSR